MSINIDFFGIIEPEITLESVFETIQNTPIPDRTKRIGKEYASINHLFLDAGYWLGTIVKIRMNEIPKRANLNGEVDDFVLAENEGVGEEASFIYDPRTRVIAMQYNHYGTKSGAFREYISKFLVDNPNQFELSPVLTRDALARMAHQNFIKRIEFKFAVPTNTNIFVNPDDSTQALINILRATNGGKISLELQSDSLERNSSLNTNPIRRIIQTLLSNREQVSVLKIYGKEEEDERVLPIDLLHDRMVEVNLFNANRQNPLTKELMYNFLLTAYNNRRQEILAQFL